MNFVGKNKKGLNAFSPLGVLSLNLKITGFFYSVPSSVTTIRMQGGRVVGREKQNLQHIRSTSLEKCPRSSTLQLLLGMGKHLFLEAKRFSILRNKHLKQFIRYIIESGTQHLYCKVSNCEESIKANTETLLAYYTAFRSWGK